MTQSQQQCTTATVVLPSTQPFHGRPEAALPSSGKRTDTARCSRLNSQTFEALQLLKDGPCTSSIFFVTMYLCCRIMYSILYLDSWSEPVCGLEQGLKTQ